VPKLHLKTLLSAPFVSFPFFSFNRNEVKQKKNNKKVPKSFIVCENWGKVIVAANGEEGKLNLKMKIYEFLIIFQHFFPLCCSSHSAFWQKNVFPTLIMTMLNNEFLKHGLNSCMDGAKCKANICISNGKRFTSHSIPNPKSITHCTEGFTNEICINFIQVSNSAVKELSVSAQATKTYTRDEVS
jgi:hypothetical protein